VTIELAPAQDRVFTSEQLGNRWRELTDPMPEAVAVDYQLSAMSPGDDVDVMLVGPNIEQLRAAADEVKAQLGGYAGVHSVTDSFRAGKEELKLAIKPAAETLGLTLRDLGSQVRQAFYGEEAQRIQRGRDDVRVIVRYPADQRRSVGDLENMRIRTSDGGEVPFLRPKGMAGVQSPDIEWVEHALSELATGGRVFDCFAILRPTSPFRTAETIARAWSVFRKAEGVDSLRAVERVRQHPGKMWVIRGDRLLPLLPFGPPEQPWHSSQMPSLPEVWVQNASLEIAWSRVALAGCTIAGHTLVPFRTDEREGFDINDQWDWRLAEEMVARGAWSLPPVTQAPFAARS